MDVNSNRTLQYTSVEHTRGGSGLNDSNCDNEDREKLGEEVHLVRICWVSGNSL